VTDLPVPIDWHDLFGRERSGREWLIEDLWPRGRLLSITAPYKAGKSLLALYLAAHLAAGSDPWTGEPTPPVRVVYLDYEMTEEDVLERVEDMAFGPADLAGLRYFLHPVLPRLDTHEGGRLLLDLAAEHGAEAVIIDTFSRVVESRDYTGHEVRAFFHWTARPLKQRGVALARLDHTSHGSGDRAGGSAAKGADVDVGWVIHPEGADWSSARIEHHGLTRVRWVPPRIDLVRSEEPLRYRRPERTWPDDTEEVAARLDLLGVPLDTTANAALARLREQGVGARRAVVLAAIRYRRERP